MEKEKQALAAYESGLNCAQAVCQAFVADYAIEPELARRFAACFGGGMRCGEVCGALTGALMVLGWRYGGTDECPGKTMALTDRFAEEKGTLLCRELLGIDIRDAQARAADQDRIKPICQSAVATAARLLTEFDV